MGQPIAIALAIVVMTVAFGVEWRWPLAYLNRKWPGAPWDQATLFIYALLVLGAIAVVLLLLYVVQAL